MFLSWVVVWAAAAPPSTTSSTSAVELRADRMLAEPERLVAEGCVRLERGPVRLTADRIELARSTGQLDARALRLTPCTCDPPSWSIGAERATVNERGAWLTWPVLYVGGVPVFTMPYGYWPLGERRSGLLMPTLRSHPATGVEVGLPVYAVLGRSWDLTATPRVQTSRGIAGDVELRNHPAAGTFGQWSVYGAYDQGRRVDGRWRWGTEGQGRFRASGRQTVSDGLGRAVADVDLLGDVAGYERAEDWIVRRAEWTVSRLTYHRQAGGARVAVGLQWYQDLRPSTYGDFTPEAFADEARTLSLWTNRAARTTVQRFAELRVDARPQALLTAEGGYTVWGGMRASATGFGALDPAVPRFFRADARPALGARATLPLAALSAQLILQGTTWVGEEETRSRLAPWMQAQLRHALGRSFGRWRHRFGPELTGVWRPVVVGHAQGPVSVEDEVELMRAVAQAHLRLWTDLTVARHTLELDATMGRDFRPPSSGRPGRGWSPLRLRAGFAGDHGRWRLRARLTGAVRETGAMDGLWGTMEVLGPPVSGGIQGVLAGDRPPQVWFVAPDELVPSATLAPQADAIVGAWRREASARVWATVTALGPLEVGLDARLAFAESRATVRRRYPDALPFVQSATAQVTYRSPCACWSVITGVGVDRDLNGPRWVVRLDLGAL